MIRSTVWRAAQTTMMLTALVATAAAARAQTVEEIIAKNIKAQGGRDALLNLKAVERKGKVVVDGSFGQMEGTVEEVVIPWKKARRALDLDVFKLKEAWNGTTAWRESMAGLQDLEGEEANQIKQSVDLNPLLMIGQRGTRAEKLDDQTVEGVEYYVLQLTPKDRPVVKIFIDKKSDQVGRMTLTQNNPQFGQVEITVEPSAYEQFGPVKLATKNKLQVGDVMQIETTYSETKISDKVDESIFDKPKDDAK